MLSPITRVQVLDALKQVEYAPGRNLTDSGCVKQVDIYDNGHVKLKIELPAGVGAEPALGPKIEVAIGGIYGVSRVTADIAAAPAAAAQGHGHGHAPGAPPPAGPIAGIKHVILVGAGKGGVGKSTVAVNLALALKSISQKAVGVLDADIYGPSMPTMLGTMDQPLIREVGGKAEILPPQAHGISVISIGLLVQKEQALVWRGPILNRVITQFLREVTWGELEYLVVDLPPGTGDVQLSLAQQVSATGAVLVTTPQDVALDDVNRAKSMCDQVGVPILGVVENMSYFICPKCSEQHTIFGSGGGDRAAKNYKVPLLGRLPLEMVVRKSGDEGTPVVLSDPKSATAQEFMAIAAKLTVIAEAALKAGRVSKPVEVNR